MTALTIQQRTLIVYLYFQNNNSMTLTQRAFRSIIDRAYTPSSRRVHGIINMRDEGLYTFITHGPCNHKQISRTWNHKQQTSQWTSSTLKKIRKHRIC